MLYLSDPDLDVCAAKMNSVLVELSSWLTRNRLVANISKTKIMLISPRPKNFVPDIYFNGSLIQRVSCIKYLGMYIDDKLFPQVNDVCTKLSRFQGITYSLAPFIPQNILLNLYNSLIYPIFTQHIIIWGCLPQIHVNKITVVINNILRNILRVQIGVNNIPLVSTNYLCNNLGLLKFTDTYKLLILKFIHLFFMIMWIFL